MKMIGLIKVDGNKVEYNREGDTIQLEGKKTSN